MKKEVKIKRITYTTSLKADLLKLLKIQAVKEGRTANSVLEDAIIMYLNEKERS